MDNTMAGARLRAALTDQFAGRTLIEAEPGYDTARQVWNATVDKRPALIACCASAADVTLAVRAAREAGVPLSVRGGGHQVAGLSLCDGGLTIDLSAMREVTVSAPATTAPAPATTAPAMAAAAATATATAAAGGGSLLGDVDRGTQAAGLIVPAGVISHTGLGGLALGGGVGWTCRNFGLTCDNVVGAELVTASGDTMRVTGQTDPELLWALRGGGGNFGVVTRFDLVTRPLKGVLFGQAVFPLADMPRAADHYRHVMSRAPDALTSVFVLRVAPALPAVPPGLIGRPVAVINAVWSGDLAAGEPFLRALIESAAPAASRVAPLPYLRLQTMQDDLHPHGQRNHMKSRYLDRLDETAIGRLAEAGETLPGPHSQIEVLRLGGAISRVEENATAFAHRDAAYILNVVATWTNEAEAEAHVAWARRTYDALDCAGSDAGYVNFIEDEPDRALSVYPEPTYRRLQEVKRRIDPDNLFRGNVPITLSPATV